MGETSRVKARENAKYKKKSNFKFQRNSQLLARSSTASEELDDVGVQTGDDADSSIHPAFLAAQNLPHGYERKLFLLVKVSGRHGLLVKGEEWGPGMGAVSLLLTRCDPVVARKIRAITASLLKGRRGQT
jgi:hypothetical protein